MDFWDMIWLILQQVLQRRTFHSKEIKINKKFAFGTIHLRRQQFLGGGGAVKNWWNLPKDRSKKLKPKERGRSQKYWKFADVLNGWFWDNVHSYKFNERQCQT